MACVEDINKEILLSGVSFKECREYIESHYKEVYFVEPGYRMFEKYLIGVPPIAIGVEGTSIIFPFTKPCYGTFLLKTDCPEEIERLRERKTRKKE
jgi:hypothetical protein